MALACCSWNTVFLIPSPRYSSTLIVIMIRKKPVYEEKSVYFERTTHIPTECQRVLRRLFFCSSGCRSTNDGHNVAAWFTFLKCSFYMHGRCMIVTSFRINCNIAQVDSIGDPTHAWGGCRLDQARPSSHVDSFLCVPLDLSHTRRKQNERNMDLPVSEDVYCVTKVCVSPTPYTSVRWRWCEQTMRAKFPPRTVCTLVR